MFVPLKTLVVTCGIVVFVLAGLVYGGVQKFSALSTSLQKTQEETTERLTALENVVMTLGADSSVLEDALRAEQEKSAEREKEAKRLAQDLGTLSKNVGVQSTQLGALSAQTDIASIIKTWSPFVYKITCTFDLGTGTRESSGSATLERKVDGIHMLTNKHVVIEEDIATEGCTLRRFDSDEEFEIDDSDILVNEVSDFAEAKIKGAFFGMLSGQICTVKPDIGDRVIILGYPGIGAKESITATEGIISGFDEEYYTTSAKIDKGNSGGAAIDVERNCFLGIPTLVFAGRIESLARILPASSLK